jgi:FkbM family methyltransferase
MFKKILFKLSRSFVKLLLPCFSSLFIRLKINKRIANYLNDKSSVANNYYNFSNIIKKKLNDKKILALDVGAQGGFNSDNFFAKKYNIFFEPILVEPIKSEAKKLNVNNKYVIEGGIWSKQTKKKIYILNNRLGSSSMYRPDPSSFNVHGIKKKDYKDYEITESIEIDCNSLDVSLKNLKIDKLDYLKVDTQGAELEILNGIGAYRPLLIKIEAHIFSMYKEVQNWTELLNYLHKLNYIVIDWKGIGSHITRIPAEMEMIFIPNFKNKEGRDLIIANENKFVSLMLIFGQLDLLKIISDTCKLSSSNEVDSFEDRFFN